MVITDENRRANYLERAEELRAIADRTERAELKAALQNAAQSYETMAGAPPKINKSD